MHNRHQGTQRDRQHSSRRGFFRRPVVSVAGLGLAIALLRFNPCAAADAPAVKVDTVSLDSKLTLWPAEARHVIAENVAHAAARDSAPPFATFDADGTLWTSDCTESFIAWLDAQGILTPERVAPELKIIPFLPGEGVYSYYLRLCKLDKAVGYPWCCQVFSGFTLAELRNQYSAMMKTPGSKVRVWSAPEGKPPVSTDAFVETPKLRPQQAQLIHALEECGIKVYIVTASPEEIARFLACSPACAASFTLNLAPERVIGVNLLLRDEKTGEVTSSRLRLNKSPALFDAGHTREDWERMRFTSFVLPPVSMYAGKVAAITSFIHPTQPPVLAAGDSGSDFPMLFYCSGARIWVEHPDTAANGTFEHAMEKFQGATEPSRGWIHAKWDLEK